MRVLGFEQMQYWSNRAANLQFCIVHTVVFITSLAKEVMFLVAFLCLFVCLFVFCKEDKDKDVFIGPKEFVSHMMMTQTKYRLYHQLK